MTSLLAFQASFTLFFSDPCAVYANGDDMTPLRLYFLQILASAHPSVNQGLYPAKSDDRDRDAKRLISRGQILILPSHCPPSHL